VYENTIGRLTEWLAGGRQLYEEKVMAKMNRDYAVFIYDYPWYDFPYANYLGQLWGESQDTDLTLGQLIRKTERLLFSSLEIEVKVLYSKLISFATHQKFGVQDDIVYAVVSKDAGKTKEIISAPHYQPFTRLLISEMKKANETNLQFMIFDISGNQKITLSYLAPSYAPTPIGIKNIILNTESFFTDNANGVIGKKVRIHGEVEVRDIFSVYKQLIQQGISIDHFYDY
jgi:hypothetical protein